MSQAAKTKKSKEKARYPFAALHVIKKPVVTEKSARLAATFKDGLERSKALVAARLEAAQKSMSESKADKAKADLLGEKIEFLKKEKTRLEGVTPKSVYVFVVDLAADKLAIKSSVEKLFKVKVDSVKTLITRGKRKRFGKAIGQTSRVKKAIVTLQSGNIQVFEGV